MRAKSILSLITLPLRNGYIFPLCVIFIFSQVGFHTGRRDRTQAEDLLLVTPEIQDELLSKSSAVPQPVNDYTSRRGSVVDEHPIPKLMEEAEERFRKKLSRQSKTLKTAVAEYRRRYQRAPPKGFDQWWSFAERNDVKLVDEYDGLMEDLEPFWSLSGDELRRRTTQASFSSYTRENASAGEFPAVDLVRVAGGVAKTVNVRNEGVSGRAEGFRTMLARFQDKLPDLEFPINAKSDSRVLVPWEHMHYPNLTNQDSSGGLQSVLGGPFKAEWSGQGTIWDEWRRICQPGTAARRVFSSLRDSLHLQPMNHYNTHGTPGIDFQFQTNTTAYHDLCNRPQDHTELGHFFSDFRPIPALYPIFSPAKAQGFLDIRIPSSYYFANTPRYTYGWDSVNLEMKDEDAMETPWEDKIDKVFWRGASTGGGHHPPGWGDHFHRHRFLRMSADKSHLNRTVTFADPPSSSHWVAASVPVSKLNDEVMDTAFVKVVSPENYPGGESALRRLHRFTNAVPLGRHWAFKYLIDLDGDGYSGRFMAFLASDSVPIKATVYKEYFSDWIEPWLHFIPLSSTYQEIYNIHAYFSGPTKAALEVIGSPEANISLDARRPVDGDRRLRRIARAGKQWKGTIGRHVDMEAYVYRLCLEWARLMSDDRDSMDY